MNTLKVESLLAEKYKYHPLPSDLSKKYRGYFQSNIPDFLKIDGDAITLTTINNTPICEKYDRIVIGDYGAFIEFSDSIYSNNFVIQQGQEYRIDDPKYRNNVKYIWLTINDESHVKIYFQKKSVLYADYKPKKFYVSVHEVRMETIK